MNRALRFAVAVAALVALLASAQTDAMLRRPGAMRGLFRTSQRIKASVPEKELALTSARTAQMDGSALSEESEAPATRRALQVATDEWRRVPRAGLPVPPTMRLAGVDARPICARRLLDLLKLHDLGKRFSQAEALFADQISRILHTQHFSDEAALFAAVSAALNVADIGRTSRLPATAIERDMPGVHVPGLQWAATVPETDYVTLFAVAPQPGATPTQLAQFGVANAIAVARANLDVLPSLAARSPAKSVVPVPPAYMFWLTLDGSHAKLWYAFSSDLRRRANRSPVIFDDQSAALRVNQVGPGVTPLALHTSFDLTNPTDVSDLMSAVWLVDVYSRRQLFH